MNHTTNYQLSQWSRTDQVKMDDFNADNAKLDAALKAEADARTALAAEVAKCGNCTVGIFTYTGTGTCGSDKPTRVTFPKKPVMFLIFNENLMVGTWGGTNATIIYRYNSNTGASTILTTWSGFTVSFYDSDASLQMNRKGTAYCVIAFYAED